MRIAFALAIAVSTTACVTDDKGAEEEIPEEGKDDSFYRPTDHGPIAWDVPGFAELTAEQHHHTWTFELSGDAEVDLTTSYALLGQRRVDTVLYLYRWNGTSWGPYIARNDDYGNTIYSQLVKQLGAGKYRALVKGYLATTKGKFKLTAGCDGPGCTPASAASCLFGDVYHDIPGVGALEVINTNAITLETLSTLLPEDRLRLMVAVQQSSHTDVTTPEEAIGRVDQGEVNVTWIAEPAARRSFIAFEYGAGDNSYGAIFDRYSGAMVTHIHDGDLLDCTVTAETCRLPADYTMLRNDPAFVLNTERAITAPGQVTDSDAAQVLDTLARIYGVTTIAAGLAMADEGTVYLRTYFHTPTSTDLTVVQLYGGDTSIGSIYYGTSLQRAATIEDLFLYGCSLFQPLGGVAAGAACRGTGDCDGSLRCEGVFAGAGACVSTADIPGEGAECATDAACGAGLVCAGATRGYGLCNPAWMRGAFLDSMPAAIPDGGTLARRIAVRGLATVDTDVVLQMTIDHPRASQLRVTLTNPATAEVVVHTGSAADDGHPLVIDRPILGFSGDEMVNGEWTLRIEDRTAGSTGIAGAWKLIVTSRYD
jgi:hypothetical protein